MNRHLMGILAVPAVVATLALLSGCATPANPESMAPAIVAAPKQHPYAVSVETLGGADTGAMDSSNIANADLKAAIENSIRQTGLFKTVVQGRSGDYELTVTLTPLSKPIFGASFTVQMEAGWTLAKVSDKKIVMRKAIKSSHTATMGDSLAGVTRLRLAVEGAARSNILQGIQSIAELNL